MNLSMLQIVEITRDLIRTCGVIATKHGAGVVDVINCLLSVGCSSLQVTGGWESVAGYSGAIVAKANHETRCPHCSMLGFIRGYVEEQDAGKDGIKTVDKENFMAMIEALIIAYAVYNGKEPEDGLVEVQEYFTQNGLPLEQERRKKED